MTIGLIFGLFLGALIAFTLVPLATKGKGDRTRIGVLGVLVAGVSLGVYYYLGRPDLAQPPRVPENFGQGLFEEEGSGRLPPIDVLVERLKARLDENPEDIEGWSLLGQTYLNMGRYSDAVGAYQKAVTFAPDNADLHSALGEALVLEADGVITQAAALSFQNALVHDPGEPISRFYMGDYAFQQGDYQLAYDRWLEVHSEAPPDTPWLGLLEQRLGEAAARLGIDPPESKIASLPDTEMGQNIQNMNEEDQRAMIEGMVAQLAARLEDDPDDLEGWARLGRSYMVLGRFQEGAEAYKKVAEARPQTPEALWEYAQALMTWLENEGRPVNDEAVDVLTRLLALDENNPMSLFYLGQAAAERGDKDAARGYWQRLLNLLGPNSPDAPLIQGKLDELEE